MPAYLYVNCCLTGVYGESDYIFTCVIDSPTEKQAVEWGHQVADAFDRQHRLQPSGKRMKFVHICRNGSVVRDWKRLAFVVGLVKSRTSPPGLRSQRTDAM